MIELTLGVFKTHVTAAVAEDLAARLLGEDAPNFEDRDFEQLLPLYGKAVVEGLNWELPGTLADEMAAAVREVVPSGGRMGLDERLMGGPSWN